MWSPSWRMLMIALGAYLGAAFPAVAAERLYQEKKCSYSTGLFGFSTDDRYVVPEALKVTRANISALKLGGTGHGDAEVTKAEGREVIVHRRLDVFGSMEYTVEIYVDDK